MVNDRFIELLTKKLSDEISDSEAKELKHLIAEDEECLKQYNLFYNYWKQDQQQYINSDLMFLRIQNKLGLDLDAEGENAFVKGTRVKYLKIFWKSAAAVLLVGICFYGIYRFKYLNVKTKPVANLETTKTLSRIKSKIYLSDGSVITLNAETVLKYPLSFNGATREVYLNGEAFFEIAKDHTHPFIVHADKMSIRVLGTAFNVKSYKNDNHSETTLIRGAIEVTLADRPSDRIYLKPNEKLILNSILAKPHRETNHLTVANPVAVNTNYTLTNLTHLKSNDSTIVETSWVNNKLVFKDELFEDLANQMERWYGVKIKFKNPEIKAYTFTGIFEKETLTQALDALKMIEKFNYKYKNETIYIY